MLAALANADTRAAFARVTLGLPLDGPRDARALAALTDAGLVADGEVAPVVAEDTIRAALASASRSRPTGPQRFLDAEGRIDRYPSGRADRVELLRWVAAHSLSAGEVVSEREVTERLTRFTRDPAALRRFLVDEALLERTRSGSEYALADGS
ncbi:DUF2087 domain-containing protein [Leifsonia shinshuensis]|uniref:DUF2087 domain-containing protein n=1 Tax=Leifsonia shinshuensis TaxID=150026 RepID=A0A7G6YEU3_9MICO|nr:DUF2087 domain-containing protein [Leifsonia shinshuensis]QNE37008.1 DUF2087 domain-containing protein [Leifsonia shinshuensis]